MFLQCLAIAHFIVKTLVSLNDSYTHEYFEIGLHMLPDVIDHQSDFGIAQLLILAYLYQFL